MRAKILFLFLILFLLPASLAAQERHDLPSLPRQLVNVSVDPDQAQAAANFLADASRSSVCCQVVGTTAVRVTQTTAGGATAGMVLAPGSAASDGYGAQWCASAPQLSIWFYDVAGAGTGDLRCEVGTW